MVEVGTDGCGGDGEIKVAVVIHIAPRKPHGVVFGDALPRRLWLHRGAIVEEQAIGGGEVAEAAAAVARRKIQIAVAVGIGKCNIGGDVGVG